MRPERRSVRVQSVRDGSQLRPLRGRFLRPGQRQRMSAVQL